jgi:cell division protein FtsQ
MTCVCASWSKPVWDDAWTLTLTARLVMVATLLFALYTTARHFAEVNLPIRQIVVTGAQRPEVRAALGHIVPKLRGSLFSMDLEAARLGFESIPWVRRAQLSRVWPSRLRVDLAEHVPAAAWNGNAVLNIHGEVFPVKPWSGLQDFRAPEGMESEVARRYGEYAAILGPGGLRLVALRVDARHAWRLAIKDRKDATVGVDLGRERMAERLRRFVTFYPLVSATSGPVRHVDMRYPNGFAVDTAPAPESKT